MLSTTIKGGGFFIFFKTKKKAGHDEKLKLDSDKIIKDDNEILEIITMLFNCDKIL